LFLGLTTTSAKFRDLISTGTNSPQLPIQEGKIFLNYLSKQTRDSRTTGASSPRAPQAPAQIVQRLLNSQYI